MAAREATRVWLALAPSSCMMKATAWWVPCLGSRTEVNHCRGF
jgi:hypothetical protein